MSNLRLLSEVIALTVRINTTLTIFFSGGAMEYDW